MKPNNINQTCKSSSACKTVLSASLFNIT